jgi:hypothetical protein
MKLVLFEVRKVEHFSWNEKITLKSVAQQIFYYNIFYKCFMIWQNFSLMKCVMQVNLNVFIIPSPFMCDVNLTLMELSKQNSETLEISVLFILSCRINW